jgi:hypothetical protein
LLAAIEYVPSLQIPVAPAGAPAGACAIELPAANSSRPAITKFVIFIVIPHSSVDLRKLQPRHPNPSEPRVIPPQPESQYFVLKQLP